MKIYACKIVPDLEKEEVCITLLDKNRRKKVEAMSSNAKKIQSIQAGLLLRYAYIQERGATGWEQVEVSKTENGKPYFENEPDLFFSISHSAQYCVVVLSNIPVGIDIEKKKDAKERIAQRFFTPEEKERFTNCDEDKKQELFYEIWCAKEACCKISGMGISRGLNRLCVIDDTKALDKIEKKHMLLKSYSDIKDYQCICAVQEDDYLKNNMCFADKIQILDMEILTKV